jgi:hypothetical protein
MSRFTFALAALMVFSLAIPPCTSMAATSAGYSKRILGCWLGARKFHVYYADGTWGVKRNEDAPEEKEGRRWHINGKKLIVTYPGDHGLETAVCTIVFCTDKKLILESEGRRERYERYTGDCQTSI